MDIVLIGISHGPPNTADYRTNWPSILIIINEIADCEAVGLVRQVLARPTTLAEHFNTAYVSPCGTVGVLTWVGLSRAILDGSDLKPGV